MNLLLAIVTLLAQFSATASEPLFTAISLASSERHLPSPKQEGKASRFGDPGDKWIGGNLKCDPTRQVMPEDHICAHRRYKCGTVLLLENARTGQRSWCKVMDRGPYGAVAEIDGQKNWYVKIKDDQPPPKEICAEDNCAPGEWRGILDVSPAAANELGYETGHISINVWRIDERFLGRLERLTRS